MTQTDNEIIKALETARDHLTDGEHKKAVNAAISCICSKNVKIDILMLNIKAVSNIAKATRREAYKMFASRVIDLIYDADDINPVSEWQIRNLVKEMVGEKE